MDSLTQIVLGAAVGEAVLGKKVGNKAILWGAIAGTIPDLDVLLKYVYSGDIVKINEMHRGFSHSIAFCLIMAPILGFLVSRIYKKKEATWKEWTWLMWWSLITHPLLDAHTTWGTQLFWPFDYKVSYNNIFIIDPIYTLPFLGFVIAAMFFRRDDRRRRILNWTGIALSTAYMALTLGFKGIAHRELTAELVRQGISYERLSSKPTPLNSILWMGTAESDSGYYVGYYSLLDKDDSIDFAFYPKKRQLYPELMQAGKVKRLAKLSEGWFLLEKKEDMFLFYDLRFGQMSFGGPVNSFVFCYELRPGAEDVEVRQSEPRMENGKQVMMDLFTRIGGEGR